MKSLTSKVLLILMLVFMLYTAGEYAIQHLIIFPNFLSLEQDEARKDVVRCVQAINREAHHLDSLCRDWTVWDDSYEFVQAPSQHGDFIEANLNPVTFTTSAVNLIYILNMEGRVVWGNIYDLKTEKNIRIPDFPDNRFPRTHPLISYGIDGKSPAETSVVGIFMTVQGPMLVSARPIVTSENKGPSRGTLIMGRLFNEKLVSTLVDQTNVDFQIFPIQTDALPKAVGDILEQITTKSPFVMKQGGNGYLLIYTTISDIQGNAALLIRAKIPRKISDRGVVTIRVAMISILTAGGSVLFVMLILLRQIVLKPIADLTHRTLAIGKSADLSARTTVFRSDEIGVLSREFDKMLAQLAEAQKKLVDQSYHSGMAEMASGIMHNVRNSLSPVVGQLDMLRNTLGKIPLSRLKTAQKELNDTSVSQVRRQDLMKFALLSNKGLILIVNDAKAALNEMAERISHIEEILAHHQKWAYSKRAEEAVPLEELVHEAIRLIKGDLHGSISTHVDPGLAGVGAVTVHRLSLLQVLENLWLNAAEAIQRKGEPLGEIHIQAAMEKTKLQDFIHLRIRDNGAGIGADDLQRIFERGFSTKFGQGSGIGLHWCANMISTMNGRIYVESDGPGKGACMHLILPAHSSCNIKGDLQEMSCRGALGKAPLLNR